ncbi:MAG: aldo/keto reductase [Sulfolobales archaeon]
MEYKYIPKLGRRVSSIGLGTGGRRTERSEEASWTSAIRKALELGILLIDTAEIYSDGFAEEVVGKAVREWGGSREDLFIVTKIHPRNLASEESIRRSISGSLRRLGLDYVDSYLIHWLEEGVVLRDALKVLEKLWKEGLARSLGVSNFTLERIEEARSYLSYTDIAVVENRYSLTKRDDEKSVIPYCEREGILYLAYTPIDKGVLAGNSLLREVGVRYGRTPIQVALNWYTRFKMLVPIPRASTIPHVEEIAGSTGWSLEEEDWNLIDKAFRKTDQ